MKTEKRPIFVLESDYQNVINDLNKKKIKNWNETETFYISKLTIAISILAFIAIVIAIAA